VHGTSDVPECCGLVDMEQYVLVLRQRDPEKSRILITESTKIFPKTAEVVSGRSKKEKQKFQQNILVLVYTH